MGVASSISKDGDKVNGQDYSDGEVRDLLFALPYGISSSGLDGIRIQIIRNDNENNVAVGVIDKKRPKVKSGCLILYDKADSMIKLNGDGSIDIANKSGSTIKLNNDGSVNIGDKSGSTVKLSNGSVNIGDKSGSTINMSNGTININGTVKINGKIPQTE